MSEEGIVNIVLAFMTQASLVLLGYWRFKDKKKVETVAQVVAKEAEQAKEKIVSVVEETNKTVQANNEVLGQVVKQSNGHLVAMENLLAEKTSALEAQSAALAVESEKVKQLTKALRELRGGHARRADDLKEDL